VATGSSGVPTSVYIIFIVLMGLGFLMAVLGIVDPKKVRRGNGKLVVRVEKEDEAKEAKNKGWIGELKEQSLLVKDWRCWVLIIPFAGAEYSFIVVSTLNGMLVLFSTRPPTSIFLLCIRLLEHRRLATNLKPEDKQA